MAAVTICSDFGAQKVKSDTVSMSPHLFPYDALVPPLIAFYNLFMIFQQYGLIKPTKVTNNYCSASLAFISTIYRIGHDTLSLYIIFQILLFIAYYSI